MGSDPPRRTFSLRAHLLLLVAGTMVPALVVAAFLVRRVVADDQQAVERQLLEAARAEAALVDAELVGTVRALEGLAQSDRLTAGDLPGFYDQARRLLATQPTWNAVSVSTPDGHQIANTQRPLGDPLIFVTDRETFSHVVMTKTPAIGNLRVGQMTQERGFPVRVPVVRDGHVIYVVSAWITSGSFGTVLRRQASLSEEWVRGVVDPAGVLVARSREPEKFVGRKGTPAFLQRYATTDEGVYRDVSLEGAAVYGAFSRAPISRWIARLAVPVSVVDAPFRRSFLALAGVGLLVLCSGAVGTYFISRRISRDISQSAAEAEAIASGLHPSRPPHSGVAEIQRLLDALARSATLLDARQRERDEHVARADAARAEAEAADRAKNQFLAMLGHELRNPLAPALTALHLMKLKHGEGTTDRHREVLERQIRHMARLVEDLLDVSRLRRGAVELRRERFELTEAVADAVEMTAPLFAERQHQLQVNVQRGLQLDADKIRIAQVLSNLLSNAAKYTEPGGHVVLEARRDEDAVIIECRDDGVGMHPDLVPRVFDLFVQGPRSVDRTQGGLGLGLAVVRTLVLLHGGSIEASSPGIDRGSTFVVRLPIARSPQAPPAVDGGAGRRADVREFAGRVMVVDDNPDGRDTLVEALTHEGFEVFSAANAREALEIAGSIDLDVAVLDIGLPGMDGYALARALRSRPSTALIRLIALTGYGRQQDMVAAEAAGFDSFCVKPVDISALLNSLKQRLL